MMAEMLVKKTDFSGKTNWPTLVGSVVWCGRETGATHANRCTSAIVACNPGSDYFNITLAHLDKRKGVHVC